jgi:hypothetical protein
MPRTALATLCIGQPYIDWWTRFASRSWQAYAARCGYALEVFQGPLDSSLRAMARSPAWQKCLILSQPALQAYDRVIWLDADIIIAPAAPPLDTSAGKIGAVVSGDYLQRDMRATFLERMRGTGPAHGNIDDLWARDQRSFYDAYGIACATSDIIQTGVLALEPEHRPILEAVYALDYPGIVAYEQLPLSAEIINRGLLQRIDSRFNLVFFERLCVHYPYLLNQQIDHYNYLAHAAVMTELNNAFFLHFAYQPGFAQYLDPRLFDTQVG